MPNRHALIAITVILGAGLLFLVANLDLPIVRNGFVYAKTAKNIIAHGFNPFPVIADPALFHGKPIGFSLLSVPLVLLFGVNAGVKIASFLGTAFFLWVAYFFFQRMNRRAGIDSRFVPLELALLFFNPLGFYQFWSAYPDSLFAGLVLLAFVLADVIVTEPERDTRVHILLLGLVIYAAILTRLYGLILGIAVPVYLLLHLRPFLERSTHLRAKVALLVLVFLVLGGAVVLARLGRNPTLGFAVDFTTGGGSGYAGYVTGLTDPSGQVLISSITIFIFALVLNFHFSLLFLVKSGSRPGWLLAPTYFAGIYVLGLLPFPGTSYNMRHFVPVFAFLIVPILSGMLSTKKGVRRGIFVAYVSVAGLLTLNYNLEPVYERLLTFNENVIEPLLDRNRRLDNLRIDEHRRFAQAIVQINKTVEPTNVLYISSDYYQTAMHGVVEELGIRADIEVRYVRRSSEIPPIEKAVYLATRGGASGVAHRFAVTSLGPGLFRLVPLQVELIEPTRDAFDPGETVSLKARASAGAQAQVLRVEFLIGGLPIAVDTEPPYEFDWQQAERGRHVATARVHDSEGDVAMSVPVTVFVGIRALERRVSSSEDDAAESADGSVLLNGSDLDMGEEQAVGLRFTDLAVPRGAEIRRAYIQFSAEEFDDEVTELRIRAELSGDAAPFAERERNLSSRRKTVASISWLPPTWISEAEPSERARSPDLSVLVQEVVARPDWQEGNALVFLVDGTGERDAFSYESDPARAPALYIELGEPGPR